MSVDFDLNRPDIPATTVTNCADKYARRRYGKIKGPGNRIAEGAILLVLAGGTTLVSTGLVHDPTSLFALIPGRIRDVVTVVSGLLTFGGGLEIKNGFKQSRMETELGIGRRSKRRP